MLTKEEHENLLREIAESGGDTPKMLELMQKLRDDYDDRMGMLRKEGEAEDKTPPDDSAEEAKIVEESKEDDRKDGGLRRDPVPSTDWEGKYRELEKKYMDRFFSYTPESIPTEADTENQTETKTTEIKIGDLFD